jgi:hypothetical protein
MVLGFSALSEANSSFTNNFLRPVESQLHIEMTGFFEEGENGELYFFHDEDGTFLVSPQCFSNLSVDSLILPQRAQISGFLVGTHNSLGNSISSVSHGVLYIFNIRKL